MSVRKGRAARRLAGLVGLVAAVATMMGLVLAAPAPSAQPAPGGASSPGVETAPAPARAVRAAAKRIVAVGAENQYANVISQVGGKFVKVSAILRSPNTDPHAFEASPSVAREVAAAQLVVQNGLGYDAFMQTIEDALPSGSRKVIVVQTLLRLPSSTRNPHLWYTPRTMPAVARAVAKDLGLLRPAHRRYFARRLARFEASMGVWTRAIASLRAAFRGAPVATTEPVADDLLGAAGLRNKTPFGFQADVMNGVDPAPQDIAEVERLLSHRLVKALVYNQQATDTLTESLLSIAHRARVPVVGVYETMPEPGFNYQGWMLAETQALHNALAHRVSAPRL